MSMNIKIEQEPEVIEIMDDNEKRDEDKCNSQQDICELEHLRKLFIGGLAPYTTEESLKTFYEQWGKVVDVVVMRDTTTKRSRGFGFITYTKASMVDDAQDNRPHVIDGKTVEAKRALPRPEREARETNISVKKLFVGGLKDNHDEQCLNEYFSQFGTVVSIKILVDRITGKRRGFAFIEFDDYDSVDKAVLQKSHSIKYVVVDVKKSVYKQEQRMQNNKNTTPSQVGKMNGAMQPPMNNGYRQGPQPQAMPPYPQPGPGPMNMGPPCPNYNYWGPPPPPQQGYGGYQQPPGPAVQPPINNWNYNTQPNGWNAGPPPPPAGAAPPGSWQQNQWGAPPPPAPNPGPPTPAVGNWNAPPMPAPMPGQPPMTPMAGPNPGPVPPRPVVPPQQAPPQQQFGSGYQQNYGGGPTKHTMGSNRMNPYGPPGNNYASSNSSANNSGGYNKVVGMNGNSGMSSGSSGMGSSSSQKSSSNGSSMKSSNNSKYRR